MNAARFVPGTRRDLLLICDHASNRVPCELAGLGLDASALARHIGWDIGAGALTERLAARLDAPAVLCRFSRLVIDPNRPLDHRQSILAESDGVRVPGNRALDAAEGERRAAAYFWPYHAALAAAVAALPAPALIAVHSFTPALAGSDRPWHAGVLHDDDVRLAAPMLRAFAAYGDLRVGDNEPYTGYSDMTFTLGHHARGGALASVALEVRQDLLATDAGIDRWVRVLGDVVDRTLETRR